MHLTATGECLCTVLPSVSAVTHTQSNIHWIFVSQLHIILASVAFSGSWLGVSVKRRFA